MLAAAARQGLRAAYAGAHGTGPFGSPGQGGPGGGGIDVIQPVKRGLDTGFVLTIVEAGGERTFLTSRGAEATLTAGDLDRISPPRAMPSTCPATAWFTQQPGRALHAGWRGWTTAT